MSEALTFRISSALKSIIGRDLITDDFAAIFELVKNSFDADAKNIELNFDFTHKAEGTIWIIDDGHGMNYSDLKEKWLFLARSAKKEGTESLTRKTFAGYKGIGRFSCDRLGGTLRIQSKTKNENAVHNLYVNWGDFESNSKVEFKDVSITYQKADHFELSTGKISAKSGLVLEISDLREEDSWDRTKLIKLRRALSKLAPPFGNLKNQGSMSLNCDRETIGDEKAIIAAKKRGADHAPKIVNGIITNDIISVLGNKTTEIEAVINSQGSLEVQLTDRGQLIYRTAEDVKTKYPELVEADFHTKVFYLNNSAKLTFGRRMGVPVIEYGSLFVVRNGFLVYPIGEENNDHWGLNRRKQQGYARYLGTREILGFVSVSGDETTFRESSSRDKGLIDTDASRQLSDCVMLCIKKIEAYVSGVVWKDKLDLDEATPVRMSLDENRSRIIALIEKLAASKSVKVLEYNKDLIGILDEKSDNFHDALARLKSIAKNQSDTRLSEDVKVAEREIKKARKEAEEHRILAEKEIAAKEVALKKAQSESVRADQAEQRSEVANLEKKEAVDALNAEKRRGAFQGALIGTDKERILGLQHQIFHSSGRINRNVKLILKKIPKEQLTREIQQYIKVISLEASKINSIASFVTKANFNLTASDVKQDLIDFIVDYLKEIYIDEGRLIDTELRIKIINTKSVSRIQKFKPLEITTLFDNFISNSEKAKANEMIITFSEQKERIVIEIKDDGHGIDKAHVDRIFEMGFSTTDGSGVGLFQAHDIVNNSLKGKIEVFSEKRAGTYFKITI